MNAPVGPSETATIEAAIRHLEALSTELNKLGFRTRLDDVIDRVPSLHVQNPEPGAGALQERVYAAPNADGWCYWWSWAEPITQLPADAAKIIANVLRSADA
jgi:hypothetical protein